MVKNDLTPASALFDMMKRYGGISYKELASLILSGKPLSDGISPVSRIDDRAWLSRFIVHAPVGSIQERYFAEFSTSALRVVARLKASKRKALSNEEIIELVAGEAGDGMVQALVACHQDVSLYKNVLERLVHDSGFTLNERAEMAVVLLVTAGCTADARRAAAQVLDFSKTVHGIGMATPLITPKVALVEANESTPELSEQATLALIRVVGGYVVGSPYWLDADQATEIGSLAVDEGAINDVESDVSGRHLRLWREEGVWYAQGLGSTYGTVLVSGVDHEKKVIEAPKSQRNDGGGESAPVAIRPGDELLLASNTRFMVLEGIDALP